MKRQRGRNRNHKNNNHNHNNHNRSLDSNGPDVKLRGTAATIYEKYTALARDAKTSGNRVKAENYRQHAEHYLRLVNIQEAAKQAAQQAREEAQAAREEAQAARQAARNDSDAPDDDASDKADNQDDNEGTARRQSKPRGRRKKADTVSTENDSDSGGSETNGSEINASGTDEAQSDAKPIADTDSTPTELDVIAPSGTNLDANAHSDKPARRRKAPKKTPNKPENREPADILAMHEITAPDREINRDSEDANATLADGAIISDYQLKSEIIS